MATLLAERLVAGQREHALEAEKVTVIVVGHGTVKHPGSRHTTEAVVSQLAAMSVADQVLPAFLAESPTVADALAVTRHHDVVVVPFAMLPGNHTLVDLPRAIGISTAGYATPRRPDLGSAVRVRYDDVCGNLPGIDGIVLELALEALGGLRNSIAPTPLPHLEKTT